MTIGKRLLPLLILLGLVGCSGGSEHRDLYQFMDKVRQAPQGEIEPLPIFRAYKNFNYTAIAMRSPFEAPVIIGEAQKVAGKSTVEPDDTRRKEYLEGFNFAALALVGSLAKGGNQWSLINDGEGGIHRVKIGNYLGRNHGRIVSMSSTKVDIVEIVPDGKGGWLERPRSLALNEKE